MEAPSTKETDERTTPAWILDIVCEALGEIEYDPCTTAANPTGARFFTCLPDNGLEWAWEFYKGLVWVNPPFSTGNIKRWANKACDSAADGAEIVMLTPVDPSTEWFTTLSRDALLAAGLKRRPEYGKPGKAYGQVAKQPAMLWYFGHRVKLFARAMQAHAECWIPGRSY